MNHETPNDSSAHLLTTAQHYPIERSSYERGVSSSPLLNETTGALLDRIAELHSDHLALISRHQEIRWTYSELVHCVNSAAAGLLRLGLRKGDRIAIWSQNCAEWMVTQFATAKLGLILVTINPGCGSEEVKHALGMAGCRALVLSPKFRSIDHIRILQEIMSERRLRRDADVAAHRETIELDLVIRLGTDTTAGMLNFGVLLESASRDELALVDEISRGLQSQDTVSIQFTSGTTGRPKGAALTHRGLLNNAFFGGEAMGLTPADKYCVILPLYHCGAMVLGNLACITHGATIVYPTESFDAKRTLDAIEQERCTGMGGVPTMFAAMLDHPDFAKADLTSLRTGNIGGAPCSTELMERLTTQMHLRDITIGYGMTETSPLSFQTCATDTLEQRVSTVGRVHPHVEAKIVDGEGRTVARGVAGEIAVRGYSVMKGYWEDVAATNAVLDGDGWMHTGDVGVMDEQAYVRVIGRVKDVIIRGGENLYPREIEDFLSRHPKIEQVAVFGVRDRVYGEDVCAWIKLRAEQQASEEEIRSFCRGRIADEKIPRYICFRESFPSTVNGKIQKFAMRKQMEDLAHDGPTLQPKGQPDQSHGANARWQEYVSAVIAENVATAVSAPAASIDAATPFADYGLDSIRGINLVAAINEVLKTRLTTTSLFDHGSLHKLTLHVIESYKHDGLGLPMERPRSIASRQDMSVCDLPLEQPIAAAPHELRSSIAIVGMSGRFGSANSVQEFWKCLANGVAITEKVFRWESSACIPRGSDEARQYCLMGGFLADIECFDPRFFGISGTEAACMDPQQRIFLEEAWRALEDAGYAGAAVEGRRCGVYVGNSCGTWNYAQLLPEGSPAHAFWGNSAAFIPARIAYCLNLRGPAVTVDTACSSSLVAIHLACQSLLTGESEIALAGGVFVQSTPQFYVQSNHAGMLSPTGHCYAFDDRADGFVPGESVAAIVLKRLDQAMNDGDHIYGVVRGSGINQDGATNGITAPSALSQELLQSEVYDKFRIDVERIQMIEAHGTGTLLGDPIEVEALSRVFRGRTEKKGFCAIGSSKTNVGHAAAAAGVVGVIKVLLSLQHKQIPASLHYEKANSRIQMDDSPFYVNTALKEWPSDAGRSRCAAVSSFGLSGTNAHVVIEEAPQSTRTAVTRPAYLVALSARNAVQLCQIVERIVVRLKSDTAPDCADVSYTLLMGRRHLGHRLACVVRSNEELIEALEGWLKSGSAPHMYVSQPLHLPQAQNPSFTRLGNECLRRCQRATEAGTYVEDLIAVAELHVQGYALEFQHLFAGAAFHRVALPTYPFARERYWTESDASSAGKQSEVREPEADVDAPSSTSERKAYEVMTLEERWVAEELPPTTTRDPIKTVLCFLSQPEHQELFATSFAELDRDVQVIFATEGDHFERVGQHYQVVPTEESSFAQALRGVRESHGKIDAVLFLRGIEDPQSVRNIRPIVHLIRALAASGLSCRRVLLAGAFDDGVERCYVESWIGFARTLQKVLPDTSVAVVGESANAQRAGGGRCRPADFLRGWAGRLWRELHARHGENALYHGSRRHVLKTAARKVAASPNLLRAGGTYLITGGMGKLGMLFAEHLARNYSARLILTGRSPLDQEKRRQLASLESVGASATYICADACDAASMRAALQETLSDSGALDGVIHAAGVEGNGSILNTSTEHFEGVIAPKVQGTLALDEVLEDHDPDFVCYFSSLAAVLGDFGLCAYAIGNRFQMAYAAYRNQRSEANGKRGKTIAINWPLWQDGGMGRRVAASQYLESSGQHALDSQEGVALFERLVGEGCDHTVVVAGDPHRLGRLLRVANNGGVAVGDRSLTGRQRSAELKGLDLKQCIVLDLTALASDLLKLPRNELDGDESFANFGFDSLSLADFSHRLRDHYGVDVSPGVFFSHSTLHKLTDYFVVEHSAAMELFYSGPLEESVEAKVPAVAAADFVARAQELGPRVEVPIRMEQDDPSPPEPIAIIGMSGRFPQAHTIEEMWRILVEGREAVTEIPAERFDWREYYSSAGDPGKTNSRWLGAMPDVAEFDPLFFEISPRDAELMDPRQRLLLQEAWRALESAGYGSSQLLGRKTGIFVGVEQGDYQSLVGNRGTLVSNHDGVLAARLAYFLDLRGPTMAINTACSSSLVAAHQACQSLRAGECDTAIAASANVLSAPDLYVALSQMGMLSPDGKCYAFDRRANGIVPAEAVVALVLKRLSKAEADGDTIHAVIRGSGVNYDGQTNGLTAPSGAAQTELVNEVYARAHVRHEDVEYIVAHGTGTRLGDPIEINALRDAFKNVRQGEPFCAVTSPKTNFGHAFATSGLLSLASLVQALLHETIPASLYCEQLSDYIDWSHSPFYVNTRNRAWPKQNGRRRLGAVSAFGMSGTNAHMVVEGYDRSGLAARADFVAQFTTPPYLLAISAKTEIALRQRATDLVDVLKDELRGWDSAKLAALSHTLLAHRRHFAHRCALLAVDREQALILLEMIGREGESHPTLIRGKVAREFAERPMLQEFGNGLVRQLSQLKDEPGRYQQSLAALGDLYCQGYSLDWSMLYGDHPPDRLPLPTYPFAKERYWVERTSRPQAHVDADREPAAVARNATALHPLAQRNTSNLNGQRFSSILSGAEFFLSDHVVKGNKVLPGVCYLEMARAAVAASLVHDSETQAGVAIQNLVWMQPLVINDTTEVHIDLTSADDGNVEFEVYTGGVDAEAIHAQGRAMLADGSAFQGARRIDLPALREVSDRSIDVERCYETFSAMGLTYGPAHRGLTSVRVGEDADGRFVLAHVTLPACVSETSRQYFLHPSVLDSALQASIGLELGGASPDALAGGAVARPALPFALDELRVLDRTPETAVVCVRQRASRGPAGGRASTSGDVEKLDIDICNEEGFVCVRLTGFTSRRLESELGKNRGVTRDGGAWLLSHVWDSRPLGADAPKSEAKYGERWVLVDSAYESYVADLAGQWPSVNYRILEGRGDDDSAPEAAIGAAASEVLSRVQSLLRAAPQDAVLLQVIVSAQPESSRWKMALSGLLKSAHRENPKFFGQVIALPRTASAVEVSRAIEENARELARGDLEIRYVTGGAREVAALTELNAPAAIDENDDSSAQASLPWKDGGVYLITGGAGGLGRIFAREIVARVDNARVILAGRSALTEVKKEDIEAIQRAGRSARVEYCVLDVTDAVSVDRAVVDILDRHGALDGVVHGAGVIEDAFVIGKSSEQLSRVLAPKTAGTVNLDRATRDVRMDFFFLFSSVSAVFGNAGQCDYATANAFLDCYAAYRHELVRRGERHGRTLSVNWPLWAEGGMRIDDATQSAMRHKGLDVLTTPEGIDALYRLWRAVEPQAVVLSGDRVRMSEWVLGRASRELASAATSSMVMREPDVDTAGLADKVRSALIQAISQLLRVKADDIETEAEFSEFGFDSISLTALGNHLNLTYGLDLSPTIFFAHPTIRSFAAHLIDEHAGLLTAKLSVRAGNGTALSPANISDAIGKPASVDSVRRRRLRTNRVDVAKQGLEAARSSEPIVVTGMSGCFPGARDLNAFWENLRDGKDGITEIPKDRWDWRAIYGEVGEEGNKTRIKWGGFIDGVAEFDALFFNISPREAEAMDPQQRLLMRYTWQAIEDAGYSTQSLSGSQTGIFVGTAGSGYSELVARANPWIEGHSSTSAVPSIGPNRMSYMLNLHGPSEPIETACSSSLVAIHRAVRAMQSGDCEQALAGGINTIVTPWAHISFGKAGMLCEDGRCKTFSKDANGYVRGEGVGMLFLKKLSAAERDGDHIYGVIRGSAENHGGRANSLTAPNPKAQAEVIKAAYREAKIDPRSVTYIEAHGTGTPLGDPIEINGLKSAFADLYVEQGEGEVGEAHCGLGSVKTNIGHLELAAGIAGVIKVLLQLKHRTLVKSLHCEQINPYIELRDSPFYVVRELQPWAAKESPSGEVLPRRAGVSSFGFGGVNAHVVIEEYREESAGQRPQAITAAHPALIVLSAKSEERLQEQAKQLREHVSAHAMADADLADIAYTLQVGRDAMEHRLGFTAGTIAELQEKLAGYLEGKGRRGEIGELYRGEMKGSREVLSTLNGDEDASSLLNTWLEKGKYAKLLELWVKGLSFDWAVLHGEGSAYGATRPRRISLPTYPFAKDRHWVTSSPSSAAHDAAASVIHPLLQRNTSNLSEQRFSSTLSGAEFFLADHVVQGQKVLPGVAYLEMARAAVLESLERRDEEHRRVELRSVVWVRPIVVSEARQVHIALTGSHDSEIEFEICTAEEGEEQEIVCAQGRAVLIDAGAAPIEAPIDLSALRARCDRSIEAKECYEAFGAMGIEYGTAHRSLAEVRVGTDAQGGRFVLAQTLLPECVEGTSDQYVLHPSVVDGALQALVGFSLDASGGEGAKLALPFALARMEILDRTPAVAWVVARPSGGAAGAIRKFDVDICDDAGRVCVRMHGFTSRVSERQPGEQDAAASPRELHVTASRSSKLEKTTPAVHDSHPPTLSLIRGEKTPDGGASSATPAIPLAQLAESYFRQAVGKRLNLEPASLELDKPLESYGLDSIMVVAINTRIDEHFRDVPRTLFFEHGTLRAVIAYFVANHQLDLAALRKDAKVNDLAPGVVPSRTNVATTSAKVAITSFHDESPKQYRQHGQRRRTSTTNPGRECLVLDPGVTIDDIIRSEGTRIVFERPIPTSNSVLIRQSDLEGHPGLTKLIEQLDGDRPPSGYERLLYPTLFITGDRRRYVRVMIDDAAKVMIPYFVDDESAFDELRKIAAVRGLTLLIVGGYSSWLANRFPKFFPLGVVQDVDVTQFDVNGKGMRKLRYMVEKFKKLDGARTLELDADSMPAQSSLTELMSRWAESKNNVLLSSLACMKDLAVRRLPGGHKAYATYCQRKLVSMIVISKTDDGAYLMDQEFYDPASAPLGHMEFAVVEIIKSLAGEGAKTLSLGVTWYPFVFDDHPLKDRAGWQWLKEHYNNNGLLKKIFDNGSANYQFKKKFGVRGEPILVYLSEDANYASVLNYWTVFYQNSIAASRLKEEIEKLSCAEAVLDSQADARGTELGADDAESPEPSDWLLGLDSKDVPIDLLTDSWSHFQSSSAAPRRAGSSESSKGIESMNAVRDVFPFEHLILTSSGREAEQLFYGSYPKKAKKIIASVPWTTTLAAQLSNGFQVDEIPDTAVIENGRSLFRGGLNIERLHDLLRTNGTEVAMVCLEVLNNASGGQPVSLEHLKQVVEILRQHEVPLVLDASRILRNAVLISKHERGHYDSSLWDIARNLAHSADHVVTSLTKDFAVSCGGLIATNDDALATSIRAEQLRSGMAVAKQTRKKVVRAFAEKEFIESLLSNQMQYIQVLQDSLEDLGVQIVGPAYGHAVVIEVGDVSERTSNRRQKERFLGNLFKATGIRGSVHQVGQQRNTYLDRCVRLAIPLGLTSEQQSQIHAKLSAFFSLPEPARASL